MNPSSSSSIGCIVETAVLEARQTDLSWIQHPPDSGWSLALDALRFIACVVQHARPRHILEFGSGLSTRVLARAAAALEHECCISSLDHDPEFGAAAVQSYFGQTEKMCRVAFQTVH